MRIVIHSYRKNCFEINSSSSHSIVFLSDQKMKDTSILDDGYGEFGWEFFTCSSEETKKIYLGIMLKEQARVCIFNNNSRLRNLSYDYEDQKEYQPFKEMVESRIEETLNDWLNISIEDVDDGYVDHQSEIFFPQKFDDSYIHEDFFKELRDIILQDNVIIAGGNDNIDYEHPIRHRGEENLSVLLNFITDTSNIICRKDPKGFYILFNKRSGSRMILSLSRKGENLLAVKRATFPLSIDMKITNYCPFECSYCYEKSDRNGKHADFLKIKDFIKNCAKFELYELAIAGGEATLHPNFNEIIDICNHHKITPSITTRNMRWIKDNLELVKEKIGQIGFSLDPEKGMEVLKEIQCINDEVDRNKIVPQIVMGTISKKNFIDFLVECNEYNLTVSLLGFKDIGFGEAYTSTSYSWWLDVLTDVYSQRNLPLIIIDTILKDQYKEELESCGCPRWCINVEEGQYTCYVDLVNNQTAFSSHAPHDKRLELPQIDDNFVDNFKDTYALM